jgi:hypothetical protein
MRAHVPVFAVSLILACTDDKDPLDGLTAATTTATSGDSGDSSDPGTTGGGDPSGPGTSATTDNSTSPTSGPGTSATSATSATTTSAGSGDPATSEPGTTGPDPTDTITSTSSTSTTSETTTNPGDPLDAARQLCVDTINMYRATLGLPPYQRWIEAETCSDTEAKSDGETSTPHGSFGMCDEFAQNECPGWPGPPEQSLPDCLAQMWAEGPGDDFNKHGHYINMSSEQYTRVSCGFAEAGDGWWMVQNFQ